MNIRTNKTSFENVASVYCHRVAFTWNTPKAQRLKTFFVQKSSKAILMQLLTIGLFSHHCIIQQWWPIQEMHLPILLCAQFTGMQYLADILFVCFKGQVLYACCLIDVSIFAGFPNVMNLLCELPCGGIQFGDPGLSSVGFETGLIYLGSLNPIPT